MKVIELINIDKCFEHKTIFNQFSLDVETNEFVVIYGKPNSGKSTLLNIMACLEKPDQGLIKFYGKSGYEPYCEQAIDLFKTTAGYLFQNNTLYEELSVNDNLITNADYYNPQAYNALIKQALNEVGLEGYQDKKVYKCALSEQRLIAFARLLLKPYKIIIADEPTANLNPDQRQLIIRLLLKLKQQGKTMVIATKDQTIAQIADRYIALN